MDSDCADWQDLFYSGLVNMVEYTWFIKIWDVELKKYDFFWIKIEWKIFILRVLYKEFWHFEIYVYSMNIFKIK